MLQRPDVQPVADKPRHHGRHVSPWLWLSIALRLAVAAVILIAAVGQYAAHITVFTQP